LSFLKTSKLGNPSYNFLLFPEYTSGQFPVVMQTFPKTLFIWEDFI